MSRTIWPLAGALQRFYLPSIAIIGSMLSQFAWAETGTMISQASDAQVNNSSGVSTVVNLTSTYNNIGGVNGPQTCVVYVFQIPASVLADGSQIFSAASLSCRLGQGSAMTVNGDLYGLGYSSSPAVLAADFYSGTLDSGNNLIQDNFLTGATPAYATVTASNAALIDHLNASLAAARSEGATAAYVFFRINTDGYSYGNRYIIAMSEAGGTNAPKITYTTTTVSNWTTVPLGGGGFVTGLISDSTGNAIYCRTDVGGAFRWDGVNSRWQSISDLTVATTTVGSDHLMGTSAIALDPSNPNRVYLAAGKYTWSSPRGIYASEDAGASWTQINSSIIMDGNGAFRSAGERLAVDPNDSNILWFGSTEQGLWKGTRSGSAWTWTQIPSTSVPFGQVASGGKAGVTFVACDDNGGSTIVYAGVYDSVGTTGGIYMSSNGSTWTKVSGIAFATPTRGVVAGNGTLYATRYGTVGKLLRGGSLQAITPAANITYRGVAVAPSDATGNTVYVAESSTNGAQYGKIWRSIDGGATWSTQHTNFNNGNYNRAEPDGTPTLTGYWFGATAALLVHPTNPNELWAADFFGVARTQNAQNLGTTSGASWNMLQKGQEETVVEAIKNGPTGPRLMTGLADVGGFRYNDTSVRPSGTAGNSFKNPSGGSTIGMDFCEGNTNVWARTWVNGAHNGGSGALSRDGGVTWLKFGQVASKIVTNNSAAGWEIWELGPYLSKQKAKGTNVVTLVVCAGNSITPLYSANTVSFDSREAADTAVRPKLVLNGSVSLNPAEDSYVADAATTTNYGTAATLAVSYKFNNAPDSRRIYLKFDMTGVATVTSAALHLNRRSAGNSTQYEIGVYACGNTTWTETGITWSNKPATLASSGDPVGDPRYYHGSTLLSGGRIAVSATDGNNLVWLPEGTSNAPRYSTDGGVTWATCTGAPNSQMQDQFSPGIVIQQLASDRVNGKFYIAKLGGNHTIYASSDGGANWSSVGTVPTNTYNVYRVQLAAAPAANDLWVSDDGVDGSGTGKGGIWRSTNGGTSWAKISSGVISAVRQISFGKAQSGTGYTVFIHGDKNGVKGVYRSDDYGVTWTALASIPTCAAIESLAGDRQNYGKVFIGTSGRGVFEGQ